jgi:hypothetical protein
MPSSRHEIDSSRLLEFLEEIGRELPRKVVLVAVGGTAMTLLKVKPSTRDIDFTGPADDIAVFRLTLDRVPHGMKVDTWPGGQVFTQILPPDYLQKSKEVRAITNIELRALHPVDIVVSKLGRLDDRDEQDIEACIRSFKISKSAVARRASHVAYVGNEENFEYNIQYALRRFFPGK